MFTPNDEEPGCCDEGWDGGPFRTIGCRLPSMSVVATKTGIASSIDFPRCPASAPVPGGRSSGRRRTAPTPSARPVQALHHRWPREAPGPRRGCPTPCRQRGGAAAPGRPCGATTGRRTPRRWRSRPACLGRTRRRRDAPATGAASPLFPAGQSRRLQGGARQAAWLFVPRANTATGAELAR